MYYCTYCGEKLNDGSRFCHSCGSPVNQNINNETSSIVYAGKIIKCPNCGELLNSFVVNCPSCGYELRDIKINSPVNDLSVKISLAKSLEEKIDLITNFYVPNTKEDITDFFILAVSNLEDSIYDTDDAWQSKLEQTYHKARIAFGQSPEFEYIERLYKKTSSKVSSRWLSNFIRKNKRACLAASIFLLGLLFLAIGVIYMSNDNTAGVFLLLFSLLFILSAAIILTEASKEKKEASKKKPKKSAVNMVVIDKDAEEYIDEYYENVVEQLSTLGFKNIITKSEKKGLLTTEGAVKSVSIAGNSEFSDGDEFDMKSKVIIRYYSKNC